MKASKCAIISRIPACCRRRTFANSPSTAAAPPLGHTLEQLLEHHRGQPLAGVILLTDGIAADPANMEKLRQLPPLYPVIFTRDNPGRDLAITNSTVTQTSFEDAPVTIQADIAAVGFSGEEITGKLVPVEAGKADADEKPIATETATVPANGEKVVLHFQIRPPKTGVLFYRLKIAPLRPSTPEVTLANNESIITVDRGAGPYRVLYVSGRPNWEYKFLHRAVEADDQTQLVGLIRIANREPKFTFRGRAGESSNPLFRGFGNQSKEDIERYDQRYSRA